MFYVGKTQGKRSLSRPRSRWKDNIRINFREIESNTLVWVNLAQDKNIWRFAVKSVMNRVVPRIRG
jgi:hypothetical protein